MSSITSSTPAVAVARAEEALVKLNIGYRKGVVMVYITTPYNCEKRSALVKGADLFVWRMKARPEGAFGNASPRDLKCKVRAAGAHLAFQTPCEKLFPVTSTARLRFAAPAGGGCRRRRAEQDQAVHAV